MSTNTHTDDSSENSLSIDDVDLPDRNFDWMDSITETIHNDLFVVPNADSIQFQKMSPFASNMVGYVVDGLDGYLDEFGHKEIELPESISEIHSMDTYVGEISADTVGVGVIGITPIYLEKAVRTALDGEYNPDKITVTACHDQPFIVESEAGTFIIPPAHTGYTEDLSHPESMNPTVQGIRIQSETSEELIETLSEVLPFVEESFGISITGYSHRENDAHVFETASGMPISMRGLTLSNLANAQSESELVGEHVVYDNSVGTATEADVYTTSLDSVHADIGDEFRDGAFIFGFASISEAYGQATYDDSPDSKAVSEGYYVVELKERPNDCFNLSVNREPTRHSSERIVFGQRDAEKRVVRSEHEP